MKYSSAKKYVIAYKASVKKRGVKLDKEMLNKRLKEFDWLLEQNGLLGKY